MKKIFLSIVFICLCCFTNVNVVNAKEIEVFYTNKYGVKFTKEEYEFLTGLYWDEYPEIMLRDEYEKFKESNILGKEINVKVIQDNGTLTRGATHTTANKQLKIATTCSNTCYSSVTLTWLNNPSVRSYDVMGAYFSGVSLVSEPSTKVMSSNSNFSANSIKRANNGIGVSFKLPSGTNIIVNQTFSTTKGGKIYASYQHAISNTNLTTSQDYRFSTLGYGQVFLFNGNTRNIYDAMNGVDISI